MLLQKAVLLILTKEVSMETTFVAHLQACIADGKWTEAFTCPRCRLEEARVIEASQDLKCQVCPDCGTDMALVSC